MSYTRTREIVLQAFAELGCPKHLFDLHSLRTGASAATNACVSDRLLKRHFTWRTDRAKIGITSFSVEKFACLVFSVLFLYFRSGHQ